MLALWNYGITPYETSTSNRLVAPSLSVQSTTQTTATVKVNNKYDGYAYALAGQSIQKETNVIKGLYPECSDKLYLDVSLGDVHYQTSASYTTQSINPTVSLSANASSVSAVGSYIKGDAKVKSQSISLYSETEKGNKIKVTGLTPNAKYTAKYSLEVAYGENGEYTRTYSGSASITTKKLTLTTQQPKVISAGNVIVAAESNLDDEETNVGFEWRRNDWTDDFSSNTGGAYMYKGTMEGYIRNLYTEKLWKYRPFYESAAGDRYYGDWVGIDPTNTSYFEPTVHTYASVNVQGNKASVKGYAMRGSGNVSSQGFYYWKIGGNNVSVARMPAASIPKDAMKVEAEGNVMTATLEDLDYSSSYNYVAFVATSDGETFYGEEQTFTTNEAPSAIENVEADETGSTTEVARYNLNGQILPTRQKGLNIVRMSDGSVKKILVR